MCILSSQVIDRVGVILGIFSQRAQTREARLQVELASLMHRKSRLSRGGARRAVFEAALAGRAGVQLETVVSARQRGRSGAGGCVRTAEDHGRGHFTSAIYKTIASAKHALSNPDALLPSVLALTGSLGGGGGSGDSELQMQRYRILRRIKAIRRDLEAVRATRGLHRRGRRAAGRFSLFDACRGGYSQLQQHSPHCLFPRPCLELCLFQPGRTSHTPHTWTHLSHTPTLCRRRPGCGSGIHQRGEKQPGEPTPSMYNRCIASPLSGPTRTSSSTHLPDLRIESPRPRSLFTPTPRPPPSR
jgi:hypothetical protein